MNASNIQRNQFTGENTSIDTAISRGSRKTAFRPIAGLACLVAAMIASQVARPSEISQSLSVDQSVSVADSHRADIIDDILDIIDGLLGGGSGGTGTGGGGTGGTGDGGTGGTGGSTP